MPFGFHISAFPIRCLPGNNGKRTPILVEILDYIKRSLDLLEYRIYIEIK